MRGFMVLLACVGVTPAMAQQADTLPAATTQVSLDEAIRRALVVQPAMVQAEGTQRNALAGERSAWGTFLPSLSASGSSSRASSSRYNQATGQIVTVPTSTSYSGGLSLSLDLFDGFRRIANKNAASSTSAAADAGYVNQRFQVTFQTEQLFYNALANEELVLVAEAQLRTAQQQLSISTQKLLAGSATRSDSLTSAVAVGNARLTLLQAQANLAAAQANLGRQIGVDDRVRAMPDSQLPVLPDTTGLRDEALRSSPQVTQAEAQVRAARSQVTVARSQYWPTLSASYSNGYTGFDAPWSTFDSYVNNWSLRFSLSWTLFNGFSREQSQVTANVARDVAVAQAADTRRQVGALLTQQLAALQTSFSQIAIANENVAAATEAVRVQQERYRVGAGIFLDLLTAEANLTSAQTSLVQARYNYFIARAQLEATVGHSL